MEENRITRRGTLRARCGASCKQRNTVDGPIYTTLDRQEDFVILRRAGRSFLPPVVVELPLWWSNTTADSSPRQETKMNGQMVQSERPML
jgi:hypothetical protein